MVEMRMHATIGNQAHEMYFFVVFLGILQGLHQYRFVVERVFVHGLVHFHQILVHYFSGPDVHVAHFAVAHLSVGKADSQAAGNELAVRVFQVQAVHERRVCLVNGRHFRIGGNAPAIKNEENHFFVHGKPDGFGLCGRYYFNWRDVACSLNVCWVRKYGLP